MGASNSKIIVLVGPYGSGKSQFIDSLSQRTNWANDSLQPKDQSIRSTKVKIKGKGTVILVDTPGFDESTRTAEDILEDVYRWLRRNYNNTEVAGLLYFHNILENRLTVPPPIGILTRLFADGNARHLIFVTTHWDRVADLGAFPQAYEREQQIRRRLRSFLTAGARMERFDMRHETAQDIVKSLI